MILCFILAREYSYDKSNVCPSAIDAAQKDVGSSVSYRNITKHSKAGTVHTTYVYQ